MQLNIPFNVPVVAAALLIGICSTIWLPELPTQNMCYVLLAAAFTLAILRPRNAWLAACCTVVFGCAFMSWHINVQLARQLPTSIEGQAITFTGSIVSVVEETAAHKVKFLFDVSKTADIETVWPDPGLVQVTWDHAPAKLKPGDICDLTLKLKRPRNYANPGSFDSEKFFFQQRIVASGYVIAKGTHKIIASDTYSHPVDQMRQQLLQTMRKDLAKQEFAGVVIALVLGIKTKLLTATQMQVLQDTGTAHLMAISGMHIGLLATMIFFMLRMAWRFAPASLLRMPAPWLAAWGALLASIFYALLAGFSIATQRALIMVAIFLFGLLSRRKVSSTQSFCVALVAVLLWDPFTVLSIGFWLSFTAVGFLLYGMRGRTQWQLPWRWLQPQIVIFIGLLPVTLLFFAQTSLIAPLANLIAIPWVCFTVVPVSLAGVFVLSFDPVLAKQLLNLAAANFELLWSILEWFNNFAVYTWQPPTNYVWLVIASATLGALWLLAPRGIPGRWLGLLGLVPLFFTSVTTIPMGQAEFTLLDVGQGLAAVVRTQNHVLVYDTGAKLSTDFDLGSRVVAPYLQVVGVKKIDTLMISHADNDHIGGATGLMARIPANEVIINDDSYLTEFAPGVCIAGQTWVWDAVRFTVLHPDQIFKNKKRNDQSCVLMVQAGDHKVLLTGDIETKSEKQLIARYGEQLQSDIIIVPHHGSKSSSSLEFLQTVKPKFAIIPVGYRNQYGHPKEQILDRYYDLNIPVLRTDFDGAISFRLGAGQQLQSAAYRHQKQRFWNQ